MQVGPLHACLVCQGVLGLQAISEAQYASTDRTAGPVRDRIHAATTGNLRAVLEARAAGHLAREASRAEPDFAAVLPAVKAHMPTIVAGNSRFLTCKDQVCLAFPL